MFIMRFVSQNLRTTASSTMFCFILAHNALYHSRALWSGEAYSDSMNTQMNIDSQIALLKSETEWWRILRYYCSPQKDECHQILKSIQTVQCLAVLRNLKNIYLQVRSMCSQTVCAIYSLENRFQFKNIATFPQIFKESSANSQLPLNFQKQNKIVIISANTNYIQKILKMYCRFIFTCFSIINVIHRSWRSVD